MATTPSIRLVKSSPFKGGLRQWSNRYHFNGGTPVDQAHWQTLSDAVVAAEHLCLSPYTTIVQGVGYNAGSDVPVFQKTYTTVGAGTGSANGQRSPLNVAALIRCSTAARSVKNHPIYLFSYIHDVSVDHSHNWLETLDTPQKTAIGVYANQWLTGFSDGAITVKRASPRGAAATSVIVEEYVTHRDFPYTTSV